MLKIAFITPILAPYRLSFWGKLSDANKDYDLMVFYGTKEVEDGRPGFAGETKFRKKGFKELKLNVYPFQITYYKGMYSEVKKVNPDLVIMVGISGSLTYRRIISWAKRNNKKVILWTCGWEPGKATGVLLKIKEYFVHTFFQKSDYFLTYSSNANKYLESFGINSSFIETCYNGIETDDLLLDYEKIIAKSKDIINELHLYNHLTFLYVGGLIKEKKVNLLIEAFIELRRKYTKIKLLIIGDGPQKSIIEGQLNYHKDQNILYLGRIINSVDPYFAASDCFVLPGIGGLALNQAMFWGKPCIVSKADGTEDDLVFENLTGYKFIENDLESLVAAMEKRINENQEKIIEMSKNTRDLILNRSNVNNMVSIFTKTIDNLMKK